MKLMVTRITLPPSSNNHGLQDNLTMDLQPTAGAGYVLGHSDGELARLERQAQIFHPETEYILQRAGIEPGMRVLDVGCGVGDVALTAAGMVGPEGEVVGVDNASSALFMARARAKEADLDQVKFVEGDVTNMQPEGQFDALVGRFILMHLPDPAGVISRLSRFLRPGAAVAFIELDIEQTAAFPPLPLLDRCVAWIATTYRKVGVEPNMGARLYATFRAAGLSPQMHGSCKIENGPDSITYEFAAETL
ncbi:MAG: class I SAM-dependent methyltransferase, partial [Alphaproteobacteria bacterium]